MCLQTIWTDEEMEEWLEEQPEVIEVCKHAFHYEHNSHWESPATSYTYKNGHNKANITIKLLAGKGMYWSGFHFSLKPILWFEKYSSHERIKCLIKKEWITTIGTEIWGSKQYIVIVASQAIFPHYPETEARYEDLPKEEKIEAMASVEK